MKTSMKLETKALRKMIELYCNKKHDSPKRLCSDCSELFEYAQDRLNRCTYGLNKPVCSKCSIHCYKPNMREKIREVMRFSGPRLIFHSPVFLLLYLFRKLTQ